MLQHSQLVKFWPEECCDLVEVLYYHFTPVFVPFTHDSLLTVVFQFLTPETHTIKCWILACITWIHYAHGQLFHTSDFALVAGATKT